MKLVSGNANRPLAEKIALYLKRPLSNAEVIRFPDGEIFVKYCESLRGRDVFIIQPTCYEPNQNLMELLIMIDAARRASAQRVTAVIPYYGYARQDRKDQPRVPITAKLVANLIVAAGTSRVVALDLHAQQIQGFFDIPVDHLYAAAVITKHLKARRLNNLTVVCPDPGSLKMAVGYAERLKAGVALVGKQRRNASEVDAIEVVGDVRGRNCLLVDDMTTTAGTLCAAARLLKEHGARRVIAAVSHAPITPLGVQRLKESDIEELITTDSIPQKNWQGFPVRILSIAGLLGESIRRIHEGRSVSSLF